MVPSTLESFNSCSHLLKCDIRSFKSERNVLTHHGDVLAEPVTRRICDPEVAGSISGRSDAVQRLWEVDFFGDDAAFIKLLRSVVYFIGNVHDYVLELKCTAAQAEAEKAGNISY